MKKPRIEFIPLRSAISSDSETYLDLLIKIVLPSVETQLNPQALNLGLVIDRSGSMQGKKIEYARLAARVSARKKCPQCASARTSLI